MSRLVRSLTARLVAAALLSVAVVVSAAEPEDVNKAPRSTLFVGLDTSGSFKAAYDDALTFVAHYLYGHMHELGGLSKPRDLFVTAIGGKDNNEPKSFHPIHEFNNKDVKQIEADLRKWFPPTDTLTDFNVFFQQVSRHVKERNLGRHNRSREQLRPGLRVQDRPYTSLLHPCQLQRKPTPARFTTRNLTDPPHI